MVQIEACRQAKINVVVFDEFMRDCFANYHFVPRSLLVPQQHEPRYRNEAALSLVVEVRLHFGFYRVVQLRVLFRLRCSLHHVHQQTSAYENTTAVHQCVQQVIKS